IESLTRHKFISFVFDLGVDRAFRHNGTSVSVDGTSSDLAVCILRNPVARVACGSISVGSDRRSANALRTGDECSSNGQQCRVDARGRNAIHSASCEPNVAGRDIANADATAGRSSVARTVLPWGTYLSPRGDFF